MLKCLFFGHKWKLIKTYSGTMLEYGLLSRQTIERRYADEYYKCECCNMWKCKKFIDNELKETKYFDECPIQQKDVK